jgi:hypothetical protein
VRLLETTEIPPDEGRALVVKKGERIRIISPWHVDLVLFDANNLNERFNQARTKVNQGKIYISEGDKLYSKSNKVLATIKKDTYGKHDLQYGMCSAWVYKNVPYIARFAQEKRGVVPDHGCWESLSKPLEKWGIKPEDIPDPLNVFQTVEIGKKGELIMRPIDLTPEQYLELEAETDILVAASPCPSGGKSAKIEHYTD